MALSWCFNEPWPAAANNSLVHWPAHAKPALAAVACAEGGRAQAFRCDITDRASVDAAVAERDLLAAVDQLVRELVRAHVRGPSADLLREATVTTRSLPALKAYLEGERAYRENRLVDMRVAMERAVAEDSTFALAHYRLAIAVEGSGGDLARDGARGDHDRFRRERPLARAAGLVVDPDLARSLEVPPALDDLDLDPLDPLGVLDPDLDRRPAPDPRHLRIRRDLGRRPRIERGERHEEDHQHGHERQDGPYDHHRLQANVIFEAADEDHQGEEGTCSADRRRATRKASAICTIPSAKAARR